MTSFTTSWISWATVHTTSATVALGLSLLHVLFHQLRIQERVSDLDAG